MYSESLMEAALTMVQSGKSFASAAAKYGIPKSTLERAFRSRGLLRRSDARATEYEANYFHLTPGGRGDELAKKFTRGKL